MNKSSHDCADRVRTIVIYEPPYVSTRGRTKLGGMRLPSYGRRHERTTRQILLVITNEENRSFGDVQNLCPQCVYDMIP